MTAELTSDTYLLIVEDDPTISVLLERLLVARGYRTVVVNDGQRAIEYLEGNPQPRLILLDMVMPVMDGAQFRLRQRTHPQWSSIPVALLSGAKDIAQQATELEIHDFVKKPIHFQKLFRVVEKYSALVPET